MLRGDLTGVGSPHALARPGHGIRQPTGFYDFLAMFNEHQKWWVDAWLLWALMLETLGMDAGATATIRKLLAHLAKRQTSTDKVRM